MKKRLTPKTTTRRLKIIPAFMFLLFALLLACHKENNLNKNDNSFFSYAGSDKLVKETIAQLKLLDAQKPFADSLKLLGSFKWDAYVKSFALVKDTSGTYRFLVPYTCNDGVISGYMAINVAKNSISKKPVVYTYQKDYLDNLNLKNKYSTGRLFQYFEQKKMVLPAGFKNTQAAVQKQIDNLYSSGSKKQTNNIKTTNGSTLCSAELVLYYTGYSPQTTEALFSYIKSQVVPPYSDVSMVLQQEYIDVTGSAQDVEAIVHADYTDVFGQIGLSFERIDIFLNACSTDGGIFGINSSNAQVSDDSFDNLLVYAESLGLSFSNPFNTVVRVGNVVYPGQMTEIYNANGQIVAAYFSPNTTSGPFQFGYEYNIGNGSNSGDPNVSSYYPELSTPVTSIGGEPVTYFGGSGGINPPLANQDIEDAVAVDDNSIPSINIQNYKKCFDDGNDVGSFYKLTLYVNQPIPGQNDQYSLTATGVTALMAGGAIFITPTGYKFNVGHAFIGFEKDEASGNVIQQVLGFYPAVSSPFKDGVVKDDGGHPYNISYTITVTQAQFNAALNKAVNDDSNNVNYNLTNYNCSDAALSWMNAANAAIPSVSRGIFTNTPGDLGQAIAAKNGSSTQKNVAPNSHGPCNN